MELDIFVLFFLATVHAIPTSSHIDSDLSESYSKLARDPQEALNTSCGPVSDFYNPTSTDWVDANTDAFLRNWILTNNESIAKNPNGFAGAFGQWAAGIPDFNCQDDGTLGCTIGELCGNKRINSLGENVRSAFYVLTAIDGLHSYFRAMSESFEMSSLLGALMTDEWVNQFYVRKDGHTADDSDNQGMTELTEILYTLTAVFSVGVAFVTFGVGSGAVALLTGSVLASLVAGAAYTGPAALPRSWQSGDTSFQHASQVSSAIGQTVYTTFTNLIKNNNVLMMGSALPDNTTIESYLKGGVFLDSRVDKIAAVDTIGTMIQGKAINLLWRQNKIFILGGGACGDNQGIGSGPQEYVYCDPDNKAWYIFFWQANDVLSLTPHQWGWVVQPPGMDQLGHGQGMFPNITASDVIISSLGSWRAGAYNYTSVMAQSRTASALEEGWADPRKEGPRWEGIFQVPICDVGTIVKRNVSFQGMEYILQPYGHESRPMWCGPICGNDLNTTKQFISAAQMNGFKSPKYQCDYDPGY